MRTKNFHRKGQALSLRCHKSPFIAHTSLPLRGEGGGESRSDEVVCGFKQQMFLRDDVGIVPYNICYCQRRTKYSVIIFAYGKNYPTFSIFNFQFSIKLRCHKKSHDFSEPIRFAFFQYPISLLKDSSSRIQSETSITLYVSGEVRTITVSIPEFMTILLHIEQQFAFSTSSPVAISLPAR